MPTFTAKYSGPCVDCDERIRPGDEVTYTEDNELTHADCPGTVIPDRPRTICGVCWLATPCGCDE